MVGAGKKKEKGESVSGPKAHPAEECASETNFGEGSSAWWVRWRWQVDGVGRGHTRLEKSDRSAGIKGTSTQVGAPGFAGGRYF